MMLLHSLRTAWRSEWQTLQKRISICTSFSVGSRRAIVVEASGDVALAAENAFALYIGFFGCTTVRIICKNTDSALQIKIPTRPHSEDSSQPEHNPTPSRAD